MRMFVTGGTGFIGRHVVDRALKSGHRLRCLIRDQHKAGGLSERGIEVVVGNVVQPDSVRWGMKDCDCLIHLADVYSFWEPDKRIYSRMNIEGTRSLMEYALETNIPKVVHVSSAVVFGQPQECPFTEKSVPRLVCPTEYARTKYEGDQICWGLHEKRGLPLVVIYPGTALGAGDIKPSGQYILNLLRRVLPAVVFPDSAVTVVHVRDVAEAIVRAAEKEDTIGQRYLVGATQLSLGEINRIVHEISAVPIPGMVLPGPMVMTIAAMLTGIAAITKRPPLWGLSLDMARMLRLGFRFDGSKAERELGLRYTPVRIAIEEAIRSYQSS
jgi:dihydroflavonol-4-reductase